jgi:hypothetical protein
LSKASTEYDELYSEAQKIIRNCKDPNKINELLAIIESSNNFENEKNQSNFQDNGNDS